MKLFNAPGENMSIAISILFDKNWPWITLSFGRDWSYVYRGTISLDKIVESATKEKTRYIKTGNVPDEK